MGPSRDIRLSPLGALILAVVSLAATIVILSGGGGRTDAQLAAETALRHPLRAVEQVQTHPATAPSSGSSGASDITAPASDSDDSSGASSSDAGSGAGGSGDVVSGAAAPGAASAGASGAQTTTTTTTAAATTTTPTDTGLPKVGHVFLLTLSTTNYPSAFASSKAPYLRSLVKRGTVLSGLHSLGGNGLDDLLAMISGQPPNPETAAGCPTYSAYPLNAAVSTGGVAKGKGCIYPDAVLTVADQVNAAAKTWGAYVAGMGATNCIVPTTGQALATPLDGTESGYDVAHNPFAFFGSLLDAGGCSQYDQDLANLPTALARKSSTPNFTYLAGDACVDADPALAPTVGTTTTGTSTAGTPNRTGPTPSVTDPVAATTATATSTTDPAAATTATAPSTTAASTVPSRLQAPPAYGCPAGGVFGIAAEDAFLSTWVPKILSSTAYKDDGVLVIAFTGAGTKARTDTGALVLSRWTPRARRITTKYAPYAVLHSIEDMLDLQPLGEAAKSPAFAKQVLR